MEEIRFKKRELRGVGILTGVFLTILLQRWWNSSEHFCALGFPAFLILFMLVNKYNPNLPIDLTLSERSALCVIVIYAMYYVSLLFNEGSFFCKCADLLLYSI